MKPQNQEGKSRNPVSLLLGSVSAQREYRFANCVWKHIFHRSALSRDTEDFFFGVPEKEEMLFKVCMSGIANETARIINPECPHWHRAVGEREREKMLRGELQTSSCAKKEKSLTYREIVGPFA